MGKIIETIKTKFQFRNYKRLWEEQNKELNHKQLIIHRQNKDIKKKELRIKKLENEINILKGHTDTKK